MSSCVLGFNRFTVNIENHIITEELAAIRSLIWRSVGRKEDTLDLKPHVLSLLVGINDVAAVVEKNPSAKDLGEFEESYRKLLTLSKQANPDILFVLGIPFVFPVGA
ncbi:hypothetical protein [uncultured Sunxiuqinia sp.]|uniref:hypothetical protein n=1 Tax=uncultured Sunxiuqinia sp. TaxID=1573825 RepID=UPI002AA8A215|nr:hypothetical protein [uncultured Sunxiuqinia sp.]